MFDQRRYTAHIWYWIYFSSSFRCTTRDRCFCSIKCWEQKRSSVKIGISATHSQTANRKYNNRLMCFATEVSLMVLIKTRITELHWICTTYRIHEHRLSKKKQGKNGLLYRSVNYIILAKLGTPTSKLTRCPVTNMVEIRSNKILQSLHKYRAISFAVPRSKRLNRLRRCFMRSSWEDTIDLLRT